MREELKDVSKKIVVTRHVSEWCWVKKIPVQMDVEIRLFRSRKKEVQVFKCSAKNLRCSKFFCLFVKG